MQGLNEILEILQHANIEDFIPIPALATVVAIIKIIMGGVGLVFLGFVLFVLIRSSWVEMAYTESLTEFWRTRAFGLKSQTKRWKKIMKRAESENEGEFKLAVLEADQILADVLARMEMKGTTTEERLQNVPEGMFSEIESLLEACRIRNNIVHDADYPFSKQEAVRVLGIYESSFRKLDLL